MPRTELLSRYLICDHCHIGHVYLFPAALAAHHGWFACRSCLTYNHFVWVAGVEPKQADHITHRDPS